MRNPLLYLLMAIMNIPLSLVSLGNLIHRKHGLPQLARRKRRRPTTPPRRGPSHRRMSASSLPRRTPNAPLSQVIPYFTQHNQQIALRVRERKMSFSGDDFTVKDAVSGQVMFQVDGSAMAIRDNKSEFHFERWGWGRRVYGV